MSNPNQVSEAEILKPVPMPAPPVLPQPKIVALFDGLAVRPIGPSDDIVVSGEKLDKWLEARDRVARQSLLAEIAERLPKDRAVLKTTSESAQDYSLGFNAANSHARELLTELAEEGDKSKQGQNR